jgi:hypothetical protein
MNKRIFIVGDSKQFTNKLLKNLQRKLVKGFIRNECDVQTFDYGTAFFQCAPVMSGLLSRNFSKQKVDDLLITQVKRYCPDIIIVFFINFLNEQTIQKLRQAAKNAFICAFDTDLWPELHKDRIECARQTDLVFASNDMQPAENPYTKTGVKFSFMPYPCDPDLEHRYDVEDKWKCDIIFTGQTRGTDSKYPVEKTRSELLGKLAEMSNAKIYGSFGFPKIDGMNYLYAVSGAKIGLSVNADNNIRLYHSDRFYTYLACGTFVLAKSVPDSDLLFKDGTHIKYFDTADECFRLADWYLKHDAERLKIADAGMQRAHSEFNCTKIARYVLDTVEKGRYNAPWIV